MKYLSSAVIAAALFAAAPMAGQAQDLGSNFKRDQNVSVRERPRPDYEAVGIKTGGFTLYPRLTVDVEHDDNIYATATAKESDVIWRVKPEASLRSDWSRHYLAAFASAGINRYSDFDTENTEEYTVALNGRLDVTRGTNITGLLQYQSLTEPRTAPTSPVSASKPVEYTLFTGNVVAMKEFNRLRLAGRIAEKAFNYDDVGALDQDNRDRKEYTFGVKSEYAVSPDTAVFLQVVGNNRNYDLASAGRDSDGYVTTVGANFDFSQLVRGEIEVGYMKQSYDNPIYTDISGFSGEGQVEWFPSALTTVTLAGSRSIEEAVVVGSQGYISNNASIGVDHELLRNVLLSAQANYGKDDYKGVDREDKRKGVKASGAYLLNRRAAIFLTYTYLKQDSTGAARSRSFSDNKLAASIALQF
jgi:hypothetical protein